MIDVVAGTPEPAWAAWPGLTDLPASDLLDRPPGLALVVAPHPDDEVLGVGGTMAALHARGWTLRIVAVTDGEASHPGSRVHDPAALGAIRTGESHRAHRSLGLRRCTVDRIRMPDGAVTGREDELVDRLTPLVDTADLVLAPWRHDGHPDHDASGRAAARAATATGTRLTEYLVWTWNWARPADERVPWSSATRLDLAGPLCRRKSRALAAFRSQIRPIGPEAADQEVLPERVLAHHRRPFEVLLG